MKLNIFQVDAFANGPFTGNPAAVCPLPHWIDDDLMQNIAAENNLSETAFFVDSEEYYDIRWFTPAAEVRLCGHATLATGFILKNILEDQNDTILFNSASGILKVTSEKDKFTLDFPTDHIEKLEPLLELDHALGNSAIEHYKGRDDYLLIYSNPRDIIEMNPNFQALQKIDARGVIVSAPGVDTDFISRGFFPAFGINEDPATGSAHTSLTPYWHNRLRKQKMNAIQWSKRKGFFEVEYNHDRCLISGKCQLYLTGKIYV